MTRADLIHRLRSEVRDVSAVLGWIDAYVAAELRDRRSAEVIEAAGRAAMAEPAPRHEMPVSRNCQDGAGSTVVGGGAPPPNRAPHRDSGGDRALGSDRSRIASQRAKPDAPAEVVEADHNDLAYADPSKLPMHAHKSAAELRERAEVAAAYRLMCSPHEWTDADSLAMARYVAAVARERQKPAPRLPAFASESSMAVQGGQP